MPSTLPDLIRTIWSHYRKYGRDLPWRHNITPYRIVVSEIMLQQTQASRVSKKFDEFLSEFPDFESLAHAPLSRVLAAWQGLGYNRRALNLQRLAQIVASEHNMKLPQTYEELLALPGIGPNTAGSILAFAWNLPHPFIETNIRTVFIHFFFKNARGKVDDKKLMPLITEALQDKRNQKNPLEWYYALMDYGSHLKQTEVNPSRKSKHHIRQSKIKGSNRELRSHILKLILKKEISKEDVVRNFPDKKEEALINNLADLVKEGFIELKHGLYRILA